MRKILAKGFKWCLLAALIFGMVPANALAAPAEQERATTVSVTPLNAPVVDCGLVDVYIDVNDVLNLYAVDVRLSFDPAVVEIVSMTPVAGWFNAGFTPRNEYNNFSGTIWYASTQMNPTPVANGSGHILKLTLRAKSTATVAFVFTYIKLSNPNGVEIPATGINGSVNASSSVTPDLDIIRLNTTQVRLSWPAHSTALVSSYQLFRSDKPYFEATGTPYRTITNTGSGTLTSDDTVLGNVTTNYFYAMRGVCEGGTEPSGMSRQVGKFEFQLYETTGTDYTWVGLEFIDAGINTSKDLANHIQNNSNGSVTVRTVSRWNASGQSSSVYNHASGFGSFSVFVKTPYRIEIDLPSVALGSVIWAQVGVLPPITLDTYPLYETTGTDYSWILQPLDMTSIQSTITLSDNIQNYSSAPVSVLTISQWNGLSQNYSTYTKRTNFGNFVTRFGYPYRVEVNVNTGFSITWP